MVLRTRKALNRPGTATQEKGLSRLVNILDAAHAVFTTEGYANLSMRKVAKQAEISIGNLNYYYRTKEDLLRDLADYFVTPYIEEFDRARQQAGESPERQLRAVLDFWVADLSTPETTAFFPELWALSNHNPYIAELLDEVYIAARESLNELVPQINGSLSKTEAEQVCLCMCAAMEGLTIFVGHEKPWYPQRDAIRRLTVDSLMNMAKHTIGKKNTRKARADCHR